MGSNAVLALKSGADADMVAKVIALAYGKSRTAETRYFAVEGVTVENTNVPGMLAITIADAALRPPTRPNPFVFFHYDFDSHNPKFRNTPVAIMPPSTALWVAVCRKVLDVFGGVLICDDGADEPKRFRSAGKVRRGMSYDEAHEIIGAVTPVTRAEVEAVAEFTAYGDR